MLLRIIIPAFVMAASAFAADLTDIPFNDAAGKKTSLKDYQGKVVLLVNLASKCGLTPQYEGLEALIGKDGKAIARFEPTTKPDSAELTAAVEKAIAEPTKK